MSMIGNFGRAFYNHMMSGFADVTPTEQRERLKICIECDKLDVPSLRCVECKCFLMEKTKWATQECPLKKWTKIDRKVSDEDIKKMTPEEAVMGGVLPPGGMPVGPNGQPVPVPPGAMIGPPGDCPGCPGKQGGTQAPPQQQKPKSLKDKK